MWALYLTEQGGEEGGGMGTRKDDMSATSVTFRINGANTEQITELHLPLEDVIVRQPPTSTVQDLAQAVRPRMTHHITPVQQPKRTNRPPPPLLRLGRPTPSPPTPPTPQPQPAPGIRPASSLTSASTTLRDSVFCSDSGSDISEDEEEREVERKEEGNEEEKEEGKEDSSSVSSVSSQGARCKEYREKSKLKRKAGEEDLRIESEKNERLTKIYNRQKYTIAKLKEYYLKKLNSREFKCAKTERRSDSPSSTSTSSPQPLVTIKTEIDLDPDLKIKLETKEEIEEN